MGMRRGCACKILTRRFRKIANSPRWTHMAAKSSVMANSSLGALRELTSDSFNFFDAMRFAVPRHLQVRQPRHSWFSGPLFRTWCASQDTRGLADHCSERGTAASKLCLVLFPLGYLRAAFVGSNHAR